MRSIASFINYATGRLQVKLYSVACVILLLGCSAGGGSNTKLFDQVNNQGLLVLSDIDSYQPANQWVSSQAEASSIVAGFIKHNGAPSVIEVQAGWSGKNKTMYFYPKNREYYQIELRNENWVLNGPNRIPQTIQKELEELVSGSHQPILHQDAVLKQQVALREVPPNTSKDSSELIEKKVDFKVKPNNSHHTKMIKLLQSISIKAETTLVDISARGDILHKTEIPSETLEMLAIWYTFDFANVEKLARINRIKPGVLGIAQTINIPAYLIQNRLKFTPQTMSLLVNEFSRAELGLE